MSRKRLAAITACAVLCLLAILALDQLAPFAYVRSRNLLRDAITRAGRTTPRNPDLVFLAIDSASVNLDKAEIESEFEDGDATSEDAQTLRLMSRQWPWPREVHARVLDRLVKAGAKAVIFDLTFPAPAADDAIFQAALDLYQNRVVVGSNFSRPPSAVDGDNRASHSRPPETLIPLTVPMDSRVAYTNFWPDEDDVVRRSQYRITAAQVERRTAMPNEECFLSLAARGLLKAGLAERVPIGLEARLFRYTAPPREGFHPRSIFEIFVPEYWRRNYKSGEFFRGKIVLIGAEGNWQHDELPTPFGSMPGPELHLNAMNAAIHGEFVEEMSHGTVALVTVGAGLLAILLTSAIRSPFIRLGFLVVVSAAYVWTALQVFNHLSLYIPCLPGLVEFSTTVLLGLVSDFTWERLEKARVRRTLEKYVSTNVVRELLDNPQVFQQSLGGVLKPATILFSDIRGYSSVSAKTDPQTLVSQLNEYLSAMVECVFRHGGTLDKFIGDAVMAVWGNVRSDGLRSDATNAIRAALEMRTELARLNRDWKERGLPEFRVGIAVNQGDVVVGNIGSTRRMEFTVVGDVVNTCWKLQELTKQFDADLIVGRNVSALLIEHFELQPLGRATIGGHPEPLEVFSVLGRIAIPPETVRAPHL